MALVRKKAKAANLKRLWSARPSFPLGSVILSLTFPKVKRSDCRNTVLRLQTNLPHLSLHLPR
jgi:hypothetical protein